VLSVRRCAPWPLKARGVALRLLDLGGDISGNGLSKRHCHINRFYCPLLG